MPFDDGAGVSTLRYVSEPWSYWMAISDPNVNNTDYNQVLAYLQNQYVNGSGWEQQMAEATLSAGSFDEAGRYRYEATAAPWCNNGGNCLLYTSDAADDLLCVDLGGGRIIKKKNQKHH